MILSEMIKKYEKMKVEVIAESGSRPSGEIVMVTHVLEDLKSVQDQYPTWVTIRAKIFKQIDKAIVNDDPDGALTWAHALKLLPE